MENCWYSVRILESLSGQIRTVYLYDGIPQEEVSGLLRASFSSDLVPTIEAIYGLKDEESDVLYPFSFLSGKFVDFYFLPIQD